MKLFDKYGNGITIALILLTCFIIYYYYSYIEGKSMGMEYITSDINAAYKDGGSSSLQQPSPNAEVNTGNFAEVNGIQSSIIQPQGSVNPQPTIQNPNDLLPHSSSSDSQWAVLSPSGQGELANINLLQAGYHSGIDTIGSSMRNANLQVRSEPPNPMLNNLSPWNISTITPNTGRPSFEIGSGPL